MVKNNTAPFPFHFTIPHNYTSCSIVMLQSFSTQLTFEIKYENGETKWENRLSLSSVTGKNRKKKEVGNKGLRSIQIF